jgi:uncharacterized protein YgfB (UPF0149 family)
MSEITQYEDLRELLEKLGYTDSPATFHGALCGALCVVDAPNLGMASLLEDTASVAVDDPDSRAVLERMRDEASADLLSNEMTFAPMLPPDEMPLSHRVEALAGWCEGFLYGMGSRRSIDVRQFSEEAQETLRDFSEFTQAGFDASGDKEAEEAAYAELVEYVRVGAQLLFLELRPRPGAPGSESTTVH